MDIGEIVTFLGRILQTRLFVLAGTPVNILTLLMFVLVVMVTLWASHLLQRGLRRFYAVRGIKDEATIGISSRLAHYLVLGIGFGIAIHTLGINLTALFAAGAIFAIGLGFAMQNIAQNFVSGVILLGERSIKPGDILQVEDRMVRVVSLGSRATVARSLDEEDLIIPNSTLVQSTVKNYTLRDSLYRLRATVGVEYGSDMALVRKTLQEAAQEVSWRSREKDPVILMTEFGDSSVNFEVSVWIDNPWGVRGAKSKMNEAIWWSLKAAGIAIAFPQLDVHFDPVIENTAKQLSRNA
ncbi:MAG: mechanosensitive ion channel [Candidatus Krumholzibacteria bacterium]|nr:mechanosensitive ion channel [Candidatus Krumholzibacteria bacterium]